MVCYSAEQLEGSVYPKESDSKWKSPHQPMSVNMGIAQPIVQGQSPLAIDAAVLWAVASHPGAQKVSTYIISRDVGDPDIYLLARDPKELLGNQGALQLVEGLDFRHLNDDPHGFPCSFFYDGAKGLPIIAQTEVTALDLRRPVARIPETIEYCDALMNTSRIHESDSTLFVSYADEREPQEFELFHLNR